MAEAAVGEPRLPEEIVTWEILIRLPPKVLIRCRAVCRSWHRRLTSDAKFLLAHHRRQPSLPLVTTQDTHERRIDVLDHSTDERRPVARKVRAAADEHFDVLASCDGLLIIVAYGGLYICNPATRQHAPLPLLHVYYISGLYFHGPSGSYRVLCCLKTTEDGQFRAAYQVYTLGSGELRCVGEPLEPWASGDLAQAMPMMAFLHPHVLAGGRIYWQPIKLPGSGGNGKVNNMLVFDTMAESFQHLLSPVDGSFLEPFEMNGTLGLYDYHGSTADLWVLEDHKSWAWSLKHRIKLRVMTFSLVPDIQGVFLLSEKEESNFLWQYLQHVSGADGSLSTRYEWSAYLNLRRFRLRESLVQHSFFSMEGDNGGGVDGKPLFDGLSVVKVLTADISDLH
ncbi:F-box protein At5g49610-like [Hordeum vulgare subsp. vulgare]|uniref:F-box domain-containing protein n=1 Tax=Hordeum vulgare subsp. vulgare TaxID=112509 RepID=A0A8I7BEP9_HORVV|nr:F-box protein At5g49610-like [Hordeum vulgare subsp. vulgare]